MARFRRVRVGQRFRYEPVLLDRINPPAGGLQVGEVVTVINMTGAPPANTMGHCYVAHGDGSFGGLVVTNSLQPMRAR